MFFSSSATGILIIAIPLELRQLNASPNEIGVTLAMFGLGMFLFEWLWGVLADRIGYRIPLAISQLLYGVVIVLLARSGSVLPIALSYLLASGMMVAAGPIGRAYLATALPAGLRATGLAFLSAQWIVGEAIGAGIGGWLIDRAPISSVLYGAAVLPLLTAVGIIAVFGRGPATPVPVHAKGDELGVQSARDGRSLAWVLAVTATISLLVMMGAGGETALLPLLITSHLQLSAATAGSALLVAGLVGGVLLVPGGMVSDRWGRRPSMVMGGLLSAAGFAAYALAGGFAAVLAGATLRAIGASLIWPAATAWISESSPQNRRALVLGLFGEFENIGVTAGPILGGLAWSIWGIQSAFVTYAAAALLAAGAAAVLVRGRGQASEEAVAAGLAPTVFRR